MCCLLLAVCRAVARALNLDDRPRAPLSVSAGRGAILLRTSIAHHLNLARVRGVYST